MSVWIHRTTFQRLGSTSPASLLEPEANYVQDPDESAIFGHPNRYWILTGDIFTLMDAAAQAVVDAALLVTQRDVLADEIDTLETYTRAFALVVLDEINSVSLKINEILDAIDSATDLAQVKSNIANIADRPQRTAAQLKTAVRNRLDT